MNARLAIGWIGVGAAGITAIYSYLFQQFDHAILATLIGVVAIAAVSECECTCPKKK